MFHLPKLSRTNVVFLAGVLFATGLAASYFLYSSFFMAPEETRPAPKDTEAVQQDNKIKITAGTDLIQKVIYVKCGDSEVFRTKPADNLVGMNLMQVQKVYGGWEIEKFDTREVAMTLKVDSYCREHANNLFIGVKDGNVAVFYGKPGPKALLKEVTKIPVSKLSSQDADEIRHGLSVGSREELLRTLEGMQSR